MSGRIACFQPLLAKFAMAVTCAGWSNNETKALLGIWGASEVQSQLDGVVRNRTIYEKLLLSYVKLGSRREVSRCTSNVMALCSRTDTANSRETYAGREVTKSCAVSNYVSADRIQVDRIGLRWNWIESRSNLVASANAPLV